MNILLNNAAKKDVDSFPLNQNLDLCPDYNFTETSVENPEPTATHPCGMPLVSRVDACVTVVNVAADDASLLGRSQSKGSASLMPLRDMHRWKSGRRSDMSGASK